MTCTRRTRTTHVANIQFSCTCSIATTRSILRVFVYLTTSKSILSKIHPLTNTLGIRFLDCANIVRTSTQIQPLRSPCPNTRQQKSTPQIWRASIVQLSTTAQGMQRSCNDQQTCLVTGALFDRMENSKAACESTTHSNTTNVHCDRCPP